jgi:23S rRNA (guanosine2251-2'-O)-methyltransferase
VEQTLVSPEEGIMVILHNIRSVHNVGSIFRTADAAGVSRIILSGYTPGPLDRFGRVRNDFIKVSLGAENTVPWSTVKTLGTTLAKLKKENIAIVAVEQHERSQSIFAFHPPKNQRIAVMLGNEVRGISSSLLKKADAVVEIPMRGKKESLNVSVAAGIALFALAQSRSSNFS